MATLCYAAESLDPVLCSGVIGELEAAGDDGDFKVTPYQNHGIRCPKFDDQKKELAGHIPQTFEYKKSTKPRGPRKTAADYCKPTHTFKHPTDIKKAEMIADMDDEMDDAVSCLKCSWDGTYEDLVFVDADGTGGGGYDFHLACPVCEEDEWLDDMMAESVDEPCFSCDGMGNHWDGKQWSESDCSYCEGSGLMSDTLRAEMAIFNNEQFDADCGCFKKAEAAEVRAVKHNYITPCVFCGTTDDSHDFLTVIDNDFVREDWKSKKDEASIPHSICADCADAYSAEHKTLSFMDWAKQEEASHLKKYGAEGEDDDLLPVGTKVRSYDFWPNDSSYIEGVIEKIAPSPRCAPDCMHYHIRTTKTVRRGEEVDEDAIGEIFMTHPYEDFGWTLKQRKGIQVLDAEDEDWVRPTKDAELCPNFDTAKGPLSGPCWDCEVCTKNGMTQEKLQTLIDSGWFHKDGTPKADKDGTALLMIEPGEPYVKSGLPAHPRGSGLLGHRPSDYDLRQYDAQTFEAPYAGAGALMGIKGDSALSSFTPSELTESSAIHGDFDQASLNYSGHQNLEVRAETFEAGDLGIEDMDCPDCGYPGLELPINQRIHCNNCGNDFYDAEGLGKDSCCCGATKSKPCACMKTGAKCSGSCACSTKEAEYDRPTPKWAKPLGLIGGLAAGYISAQMIDNAKE